MFIADAKKKKSKSKSEDERVMKPSEVHAVTIT